MAAEDKNKEQQNGERNPLINKGEQGLGRAGHESHDISQVDCQEGMMNNGVLGGNFESIAIDNKKEEEKK